MPCHDPDPYPDNRPSAHAHATLIAEADRIRRKLDERTATLCAVMTLLDKHYPDASAAVQRDVADLAYWWKKHQEEDAARIAKEKAEVERKRKAAEEQARKRALWQAALAKLTPEERKALSM
jgi:hypothetical protein